MRGHVFKRSRRWTSVIYLGKDETGQKHQQWLSHPTRAEAEEHVARVLAARADGRGIPPRRQLLREYLAGWIQQLRANNVSPLTRLQYERHLTKHAFPVLGHHALQDLSPLHVHQWIGQLQAKGLSPGYVFYLYSRLRTALADAVDFGLIARNPAERAGRRRSFLRAPRARDPEILDHEQLGLFLGYLRRTSPHAFLFKLDAKTGLRRGELLGLRRADVTWGLRAVLTIKQAASAIPKEGVVLGPPKSPSGRRAVKLTRQLTEELRQWIAAADRAAIIAGRQPTEEDLIFAHADGRPLRPDSISRHFTRLRERFTTRHVRLHDLRHTHASQLLADRVPLKVVQERLGHSRASYTLDKYVHTLPTIQDEAVHAIERREGRGIPTRKEVS